MQNVFEENIFIIKLICSAAIIYIAYIKFGFIGIKLYDYQQKIFPILQSKKTNNIQKVEEKSSVELKNNKHILLKLIKNQEIPQDINQIPFNFTPIVNKFSILTHNILCQKFMMRRDRKDLSLENRMEKIKEEIQTLDPDIICLQETVFHSIKLFIENFLSVKYEIFYMDNYGSNFYNLTAFKKDKFEIKENKKINLEDIKVEGNRGIYCTELKIKNYQNTNFMNSDIHSSSDIGQNSNLSDIKKEKNIENFKKYQKSNSAEKADDVKDSQNLEDNHSKEEGSSRIRNSKNKSRDKPQNFFYNYKNFIEYNKAENKNKLVIYNVHFPWKPEYDFEKCLILNKIADDIITKNQRNYLIIGDFNSKPNSLVMRMIYIENFINEIKYFKNIFNFKNNYFSKRNSDGENNLNKKDKLLGFYEEEIKLENKSKKKYNFIYNEKFETYMNKSEPKKAINDEKITELISNFDILKELDNNSKKNENIKKNLKDNSEESKDMKKNTENQENNLVASDNFWSKLSEQKHLENEKNRKIKDFDILRELFSINVKMEKERYKHTFDSKDKVILKEMLKLLNLSNNKKTFQDVFATDYENINNSINNFNYIEDGFSYKNFKQNDDFNQNFSNSHFFNEDFEKFDSMNLNISNKHSQNYYFLNNSNYPYQIVSANNNQKQTKMASNDGLTSYNQKISISNDTYIKIKDMIENFKNLFMKYRFKSAYETYQEELNHAKGEILKINRISGKDQPENNYKDENSKCLNEKMEENIKEKEINVIAEKKKNKPSEHVGDYFKNHPLYTNFTDNFKDTIDYIFYSKYLIADKILKLPDYDELSQEGYIPSSKHPSDHLPLYAEFSTN